jgi:hypothetical protein
MRRREPLRRADEHLRWLKNISSPESFRPEGPLDFPLGALTGTDHRALEAIDRLWHLYCSCDHPERVLWAIAYAASEMQVSTRPLARELAAHAREWSDRERLWPLVEERIMRIAGQS